MKRVAKKRQKAAMSAEKKNARNKRKRLVKKLAARKVPPLKRGWNSKRGRHGVLAGVQVADLKRTLEEKS